MTTLYGKCHCGNVEWIVKNTKPEENKHILCHCNTCKTLSGTEYTLNLVVPKEDVEVTKGKDRIKEYTYSGDSGNPVHCYYCDNCTAHPYHYQTVNADKYVVRTPMLKDVKGMGVNVEIYTKDRYSFQKDIDSSNVKTFEALP